MTDLSKNTLYNFFTYAEPILGNAFKNMKFLGEATYEIADQIWRSRGSSLEYMQRRIEPFLPSAVSKNHLTYTYYLFRKGEDIFAIAKEWIVPNSIELAQENEVTIRLTGITETKYTKLKEVLRALNIQFTEL